MNEQIFTTEFMSKLEKLSIYTKNTAIYGSSGSRKSKAKGMSVEFTDYRKYVPSDDFRKIDWNAYGKFKKLYIKLFMEEKEAVFNIFIDNSKSMAFNNKNKITLQLAAAFSYIALNNLDKVLVNPIISYENSNIFLGQGKKSFMKYINFLENIKFDKQESVFHKLKKVNYGGNGISIILSDLFVRDDIEDIIKFLTYNKQQILVLHVLSPEEITPKIDGRLKLVDSETGNEKNLIMTPNLYRKYNKKLDEFCTHINDVCHKYGAYYMRVNSSETVEKIILEDVINAFMIL